MSPAVGSLAHLLLKSHKCARLVESTIERWHNMNMSDELQQCLH